MHYLFTINTSTNQSIRENKNIHLKKDFTNEERVSQSVTLQFTTTYNNSDHKKQVGIITHYIVYKK